jgi:hypothetical protein
MVKYLSMDGVDDYIELNFSFTVDSIEIDGLFASNSSSDYCMVYDLLGGTTAREEFKYRGNGGGSSANPPSTGFIKDERTVLTTSGFSFSSTMANFFRKLTNLNYAQGNLYSIKLFNSGTLVAHYDMSTGTVDDISGNGNHATLNGGTWLDDGTGGGTDVPRQIGTLKINNATLPIMELTDETKHLRIRTQNANGYLDTVDITDTNASNLRINTSSGVKAIRKL